MKTSKSNRKGKSAKKLGKSGSSQKSGLPPGSLVHIGHLKTNESRIDLIVYNADNMQISNDIRLEEALAPVEKGQMKWIKVTGLQDTQLIDAIGKAFDMHMLLLEDILNTGQRPKVESGDDYVFFTFRTLHQDVGSNEIFSDQISLLLKEDVLISFHESELTLFDPIFNRFQNEASRLRQFKSDYLFYAIIDVVVDQYFKVIENLGEEIDVLEEHLFDLADKQVLEQIQQSKRDLLYIKKSVFPLREALNGLIKNENKLIEFQHIRYFYDVYDHILQMIEIVETYRELNSGIRDIFLSAQSNKMNQIVQMLTIISTVFIPLTFIVGVYGMNFKFMPELDWKFGYLAIWIIMIAVAIGMIMWFKQKRWT
ncbi:MAG: magnesium/cobalt transporter CorA [Ignavibacteria bacterium]|nr:magnesium/cobalt transporter CorA [Ignavibacteria bacterium]